MLQLAVKHGKRLFPLLFPKKIFFWCAPLGYLYFLSFQLLMNQNWVSNRYWHGFDTISSYHWMRFEPTIFQSWVEYANHFAQHMIRLDGLKEMGSLIMWRQYIIIIFKAWWGGQIVSSMTSYKDDPLPGEPCHPVGSRWNIREQQRRP